MKTELNIDKTVKAIQGWLKRPENRPRALPDRIDNSDTNTDHESHGLVDPGYVNAVTGNGHGPVMGGRR